MVTALLYSEVQSWEMVSPHVYERQSLPPDDSPTAIDALVGAAVGAAVGVAVEPHCSHPVQFVKLAHFVDQTSMWLAHHPAHVPTSSGFEL